MYLLDERQITQLAKGEITPDEVMINDNFALCTLSGEDIKNELEDREITGIDTEKFDNLVQDIEHKVGKCDCLTCMNIALEDFVAQNK